MTRAETEALKVYKPFIIGSGPNNYPVDAHEREREAYIRGYEQAEKDIIELIENKIKAIKKAHERGYWLDVISELEDIIEQID